MPRKPVYRAVANIDRQALAEFQAGIRKRYTDEQILAELKDCAERLGRSPTMREFAADKQTSVHPQTVIEHFGSWNRAKRLAGLVPRRFATRAELLGLLRELGEELGRPPSAKDIDARKGSMPSKSLYWHTFGSLTNALREAGFDVPDGEERLEREVEQGAELALRPDPGHGEDARAGGACGPGGGRGDCGQRNAVLFFGGVCVSGRAGTRLDHFRRRPDRRFNELRPGRGPALAPVVGARREVDRL